MHCEGKILIVDEAHGTHFPFSKLLPETALEQGADICSKFSQDITTLTQSAVLHIGSALIDFEKIQRNFNDYTTSPSYICNVLDGLCS